MHRLLIKIAFAIACLFASNCYLQAFEVQGHRGARGLFPENTIPGFIAAIEGGADTIELDLLLTADHEIVIYHDFYLDKELCTYLDGRPLKKSRSIAALRLEELKAIDCGSKVNPKFPRQVAIAGTQIPTLQELFNVVRLHPQAQKVRLNLEIKINPFEWVSQAKRDFIARKIVQAVKESKFSERVIYSSFDLDILRVVRKIDATAKLSFIFNHRWLVLKWKVNPQNWVSFAIQSAAAIEAEVISPEYTMLDAENVQQLHAAGLRVIPWTVNEVTLWSDLHNIGVDGIITDYPSDMIQWTSSFNKK